ncbi:MAG: alkaline shock response membrane anchor protein AmaP [Clostridia bacterium]|nr:alkaline shock response membrane anchor protein AmaP [Clostridia bacterium]
MKILERLALVLFSIIMIVIAITSCLVIFNVVELSTIYKYIEELLKDDIAKRIILGASAVAIILAIKALFFPSRTKKKQEIKTGVLLENKDGRLLISKDTIENLVNSVVRSFDEAVDTQTKVILDANNNITVFVSLLVKNDSIIKEMSASMQTRIKDTIKRNTDLDVNQVNINIKDIDNSKNTKNNDHTKIKVNNIQINKNQTNENKEEIQQTQETNQTTDSNDNSNETSVIK